MLKVWRLNRFMKHGFDTDAWAKYWSRCMHYHFNARKVGVHGAPFELGQQKTGVSRGPDVLRQTEFIETLQTVVGLDIKDYGNIQFDDMPKAADATADDICKHPDFRTHKYRSLGKPESGGRNESDVGTACQKIADSTEQIIKDGRICLTLGGDHSIAMGTVSGAARCYKRLAVIWVDAHADINTTMTSVTGNMHGMPISFLLKELESYNVKSSSFSWLKPLLSSKCLVYIGLRDVESYERSIIKMLGIKTFSMAEVDKYGINFIAEMALDYLSADDDGGPDRPIHVSFDVDALDDLEIKCTGTPVPGGLTLREGMRLMEKLRMEGNITSIDVVEFNPDLGDHAHNVDRSSQAIKELIFSSFGYYRGGVPVEERPIPKP